MRVTGRNGAILDKIRGREVTLNAYDSPDSFNYMGIESPDSENEDEPDAVIQVSITQID